MHAEQLLWSIGVPSLVLIAQAVFLLQHRQSRLNALPTPAAVPTWVINKLLDNINQVMTVI